MVYYWLFAMFGLLSVDYSFYVSKSRRAASM